jgi:hypothetical protein
LRTATAVGAGRSPRALCGFDHLQSVSTENAGTMIARATGLVLIIMGASSLLYLLPWLQPPAATSGWTSYSPPSTTTPSQDLMTHLHDTYYVVSSFYLPSVGQALAGVVMILLSRPVGRWLAKGLSERDTDDTA